MAESPEAKLLRADRQRARRAARTAEQRAADNTQRRKYRTPESQKANTLAARKRRAADPVLTAQRQRAANLRRYGLDDESVQLLYELQAGACGVCRAGIAPHGESKHTHIDHCHETGRVRGLLCHHCNMLLGHAKDSTRVLASAMDYLRRNSK